MIIVGAGSAGMETAGIFLHYGANANDLVFFDENSKRKPVMYREFPIIHSWSEIAFYVKSNPEFCVCIGNPRLRKKMFQAFIELGGVPKNIVAKHVFLLSAIHDNASVLQPGVSISYNVSMGKSCLIHANSVIGHSVVIGDFVNISPICSIIGPCNIGNETYIGAHSLILPNLHIGNNVYIPAGSMVNRDVQDYETFG
jgi:sugar O-acyltransferase (sialic acid O-acetyltransferase NeuD family)